MTKNPDRIQTEGKINAHAWKDPAFKRKLLSDPQAALKEMGMENIPPSLKIQVIDEEKNHWVIVLHVPPANTKELSEEELSKLSAAGICWGCSCR